MLTQFETIRDRGVTAPAGFRAGSGRAGLKSQGDDIILVAIDRPGTVAGIFTTNRIHAASVDFSSQVADRGFAMGVVANAGCANACTGIDGAAANVSMARSAAAALGIREDAVITASTGVIGQLLPVPLVEIGIAEAAGRLGAGQQSDEAVARAILTTDLRTKMTAAECRADTWEGPITIGAVCKGSGMIAPNMATMLAFISTDAQISPAGLRRALVGAAKSTLNSVTVDGDTSTNDMAIILASNAGTRADATEEALEDFTDALTRVCDTLARSIARDGEGANHLVSVRVVGAASDADARRCARSIAESPLVKTALFGRDPNWGRILAAAGRSGAALDPERVEVHIGTNCVCARGTVATFDADEVRKFLQSDEVELTVDLGVGAAACRFFTCDLSYDYIRINAEYHT
ncbi:MAG: bifunctional glutamate N-acetyltransferase/amino-acid acetyltransferase ArgJ [Armatimonadetes bacterium]|nr:bifunctional glutamate N-acetyltransferase/amino-acid acetyltransferase ArgJ [Armatimonadota bacterium]MDE2206963.1 bifunctional glutamate N-acetyltransferase/amino-acid acetyltransferase ArgJ [Armatimonadota bacterium]